MQCRALTVTRTCLRTITYSLAPLTGKDHLLTAIGDNFTKLVQESFPEESNDTVEKYIDRLFAVWDECTKFVARYAVILLIVMISFELINRAIVKEFSVGPIKVVDVLVVKIFLPVLAAYFMFRVMSELIRWREIERIYSAILKHLYPKLYKTNLGLLLHPTSPLQSNMLGRTEFAGIRALNFRTYFQGALGGTLTCLAPLFILYAYWQLFAAHGFSIITLLSAVLSTIFIGAYAVLIVLGILRT
jgi:hypothetical protein